MVIVQMAGIVKRFPGVLANDQVNLELHKGEIHGLLGENGAGKTTLMNVLFGLYQPDAGQILVRGQAVTIASPADAIRNGIGMVHQHFRLVPPLTVAENIVLGLDGRGLLDLKAAERRVREVAGEYGIQIDPGCSRAGPFRGPAATRRDPEQPLPGRGSPDPRRADRRANSS